MALTQPLFLDIHFTSEEIIGILEIKWKRILFISNPIHAIVYPRVRKDMTLHTKGDAIIDHIASS